MDGGSWALVLVAFIGGMFGLAQTILTQRKLGRIEKSGERIEQRADDIDDKASKVHDQVRTSDGRTVVQMVEDNTGEIAQLRGDVMELAIQLARHTSDHHTHDLIRRQRQSQRDRQQLGRDYRELRREPESDEDYGQE